MKEGARIIGIVLVCCVVAVAAFFLWAGKPMRYWDKSGYLFRPRCGLYRLAIRWESDDRLALMAWPSEFDYPFAIALDKEAWIIIQTPDCNQWSIR